MKNLQVKLMSLITNLKGKSKKVIIGTLVVVGVCIIGVRYGYISEDMIDIPVIVSNMEEIFASEDLDSIQQDVDTLFLDVDSSKQVLDGLNN